MVGLGNPGAEYAWTRHNVGWMALDALSKKDAITWKQEKDLSHVARWGHILLLKPGTYMNASGQAVRHYVDYYDVSPDAITVVHDDLDIPFGEVREKSGGGAAGHHGIESIYQHVGNEVARIRVGIGRPSSTDDGADYVLSRFSAEEEEKLPEILERAAGMIREAAV